MSRTWKITLAAVAGLFVTGLLLPQDLKIPVAGASSNDWNPDSFWYEPWGASGVHKGIDIFGPKGTAVAAPTFGIILFTGNLSLGGNVVAMLGPKWRIHYFAHLESIASTAPAMVGSGDKIGTLGDSGNAVGKQPHLHYSIATLIPYPWLFSTETQGWKKMFIIDPQQQLSAR